VDSAERPTSSTVCEKARARAPLDTSLRLRERGPFAESATDPRKINGDTCNASRVTLATLDLEELQQERKEREREREREKEKEKEKERGRNQSPAPGKFARAPFFARTRRVYTRAYAITYLLMLL